METLHERIESCRFPNPTSNRLPKIQDSAFSTNEPQSQSVGSLPMEKPQWKHLFAFTTPKHLMVMVPAICFSLLSGVAVPINSYLIGKIFSTFSSFGAGQLEVVQFKEYVIKYILYIIIIASGCWFSSSLAYLLWNLFAGLQGQCARHMVFNAMLQRPVTWYERRKDGAKSLSTRISSYIHDLQTATGQPMSMITQYLCSVFGSFGLAFYLSWKLTLVIIAGIPIMIVLVPVFSSQVQPNILGQANKLGEAAKITSNAFSAIEMVKCYNGEDQELQSFARVINESAQYFNRQAFWNALQASVLRLTTLSMFVQGFWYGNSLLDNGDLTVSQILSAFWGAVLAIQFLMQITPFLVLLEKGKAAGQKLRAAVFQMEDMEGRTEQLQLHVPDSCVGDITFENVSFSYPTRPDSNILRDANLFFAAGEITYVVGNSGSGKSTLGQLLLKFYDPNRGVIKLDGQSIHNIDTPYVRENILLVEQESILFNGTILENICLGHSSCASPTQSKVYQAADFAHIRNDIEMMPQGFKTQVGAKGATLSGGQRQRVALARAWIRNPTVLVLDESTSALDYINRVAVMNSIRKWRRNKTTIIITHDLTQILPKEFVYVMREGKVVQEGFRGDLEKDSGSLFHEFLFNVRHERNHVDESKQEYSDSEDSTNSGEVVQNSNDFEEHSFFAEDLNLSYLQSNGRNHSNMPLHSLFARTIEQARRPGTLQFAPILSPIVGNVPPLIHPSWASVRSESVDSSTEKNSGLIDFITLVMPKFAQRVWKHQSERFSGIFQRRPFRPGFRSATGGDLRSSHSPSIELATLPKHLGKTAKSQKRSISISKSSTGIATIWIQLHSRERVSLLIAIAGSVVFAVSTPMFSYVFSKLLSTFYVTGNRKTKAIQYSLEILAVSIIDAFAIFITQTEYSRCGQAWVNHLRLQAFRNILSQSRQFFFEPENGVSKLSECLDQHAEEMQHILGRYLGVLLVVMIMLGVTIVWSLISCWKLTLVLLACSPILYAVTSVMQIICGEMNKQHLKAEEGAGAILNETITSIKTVRALTLEDRFRRNYQNASEEVFKASIRKALFSAPIFGLSESSLFYINALVFYYGSVLIASGSFSLQQVIQSFVLLLFGVSNAMMLISAIPQMSVSREAAHHVSRLTSLPSECHEHVGKTRISMVGNVEFRNVAFSYPSRPDDVVLRNFNLNISMGTCVALVGLSGSGKSTLASLLVNLYTMYNPISSQQGNTSTNITLSGHVIQEIHTPTLRSLVALVSQTPVIFPGTVADNIAYGIPDFSTMRSRLNIRRAAEATGLDSFISNLPQGYDTPIGDGGTSLSGGQAQRLTIARALIRQPNVLILDEVTSALDSASAAVVRDTIRNFLTTARSNFKVETSNPRGNGNMANNHTVVIITHSLDMMKLADQICMMDHGSIVENGTYDELMRARGPFYNMVNDQKWEQDEAKVRRRSIRNMTRSGNNIFISDERSGL